MQSYYSQDLQNILKYFLPYRQLYISHQLQIFSETIRRETGDLIRRVDNHRFTINTKKIKEPIGEHFNLDGYKREDMMMVLVINQNPD